MDRSAIRAVVARAVGEPTSGAVADVIDPIADALDAVLNAKPAKNETRVVRPDETPESKTK